MVSRNKMSIFDDPNLIDDCNDLLKMIRRDLTKKQLKMFDCL